MNGPHESWPPYCCVAAFAHAALHQLGAECPSRSNLARLLDTQVPEGSANPWSLRVVSDRRLAGVLPTTAVRAINHLLNSLAPSLRMRHVPFRSIAMKLYADLADEATKKGVVVGIGLDWVTVAEEEGGLHRHLLRLLGTNERSATLLDDSIGVDAKVFDVPWAELERSVHVVDDGFWLVGPVAKLSFDTAGPWTAPESS